MKNLHVLFLILFIFASCATNESISPRSTSADEFEGDSIVFIDSIDIETAHQMVPNLAAIGVGYTRVGSVDKFKHCYAGFNVYGKDTSYYEVYTFYNSSDYNDAKQKCDRKPGNVRNRFTGTWSFACPESGGGCSKLNIDGRVYWVLCARD